MQETPKKLPKWTARFPCPSEVTLYLSAKAMRANSKKFTMPPPPDWPRIIEDLNNGVELKRNRAPYTLKNWKV